MPDLIATFERTLSASDAKQHIPFSFDVPAGATRLTVRLSFAPPIVDDIRNMLTLSLFDPAGWRGAGHRHGDRHEVTIGEREASPGHLPGPLPPGRWTAVVDTHMIMSGAPCAIRLEVSADVGEGFTPALSAAPPVHAARRGPGWYRGDLHAHSLHSDASWDIPDLLAWARARRLDFCTLSDHNTVSGLAQFDAACAGDLLTMGGMELTTFWGHALALGLREWIDWRVQAGARTMPQIAAEVEARGGLFVIAHPMSLGDPYCTGCQWRYDDMMPGSARVVEVWNSHWGGESRNEASLRLAFDWLNAGHRLALSAGTDNHGRNVERMHHGFNVVCAEDLSEPAILHAVRAGHAYLSAGPLLTLHASAGEQQVMMGDVLRGAAGPVQLLARWDSAPAGAELTVFADGKPVAAQPVAAAGAHAFTLDPARTRWCLLTLRDPDNRMLTLTNPIYFEQS